MKALIKNLIVEESGQDLIEYALLAGFISLIAVGAIELVGDGVLQVFTTISQTAPLAAP